MEEVFCEECVYAGWFESCLKCKQVAYNYYSSKTDIGLCSKRNKNNDCGYFKKNTLFNWIVRS